MKPNPDEEGELCPTLTEALDGERHRHESCGVEVKGADIEVLPAEGTEEEIANSPEIDPENGLLCHGTPLAAALRDVGDALEEIQETKRRQRIVVITDGGAGCEGLSHPPLDVVVANELAAKGIEIHVIGFGDDNVEARVSTLNDLACAGRTAPNPKDNCITDENGFIRAKEGISEYLFLEAESKNSDRSIDNA